MIICCLESTLYLVFVCGSIGMGRRPGGLGLSGGHRIRLSSTDRAKRGGRNAAIRTRSVCEDHGQQLNFNLKIEGENEFN